MATQYDPSIILTFADRLYEQARTIIILYALAGMIVVGLVGAGIGFDVDKSLVSAFGGGGAVLGLLFGIMAGRARAFVLRLQAQQALCQVQIERNTTRDSAQRAA